MTNREIAQEISNRIGTAPVPFDSVYSIALEIYHQLGGEESQFDSVYSILLEILPLVEGGGSGKAIEIVDALPEASENKEKFYRLSSDDNVYVSELKSRTTITTNRLPDEQQIDKAYLFDTEDNSINYYKGVYHIICNDGETDGYMWYQEGYVNVTLKNAETITNSDKHSGYFEVGDITIDEETKTITIDDSITILTSYQLGEEIYVIPAIYNAPETNQIGNAEISYDGDVWIYSGEEGTVLYEDEPVSGYKWIMEGGSDYLLSVGTKKASEMVVENIIEGGVTTACYYDFQILDSREEDYINPEYLGGISIKHLNAPDSEQVGNAYIIVNNRVQDYNYNYNGESINVLLFNPSTQRYDTPATMYLWQNPNYDDAFGTEVNASNVYGQNQFAYCHYNEDYDRWEGDYKLSDYGFSITSINTDEYQRTETIEEWDWKKVAVKEDIKPAIIDVDELPETIDDSNKGNIYRIDDGTYMAANYDGVWGWDYIATNNELINATPVIYVNADLVYNQDMTINSIDNVEYTTSTGEELSEISYAASINANLNIKVSGMQMGTVTAIGTFSRYFVDMGPLQNNYIRFTLPFMNLANQSQDTLLIDYDGNDDTWTFRLQGA